MDRFQTPVGSVNKKHYYYYKLRIFLQIKPKQTNNLRNYVTIILKKCIIIKSDDEIRSELFFYPKKLTVIQTWYGEFVSLKNLYRKCEYTYLLLN